MPDPLLERAHPRFSGIQGALFLALKPRSHMDIERMVIGAPFGNWLHFRHTTPTIGTYTRSKRAGTAKRLWRIATTVRYDRKLKAWFNRLGLPSPGIAELEFNHGAERVKGKILSLAGHSNLDWFMLFEAVFRLNAQAIELNPSCPNCPGEDKSDYKWVFKQAAKLQDQGVTVTVKLPPIYYERLLWDACHACLYNWHCCNTYPTLKGGMSGKPLQMMSLRCIETVRKICPYARMIIGGGGITGGDDVNRFLSAGATKVSVASVLFFPWKWPTVIELADILAK